MEYSFFLLFLITKHMFPKMLFWSHGILFFFYFFLENFFGKHRPTHGSNLLYQNARLPKSNDQEGNFKMKKFLRVEGRVNSNNNRRK